MRRVILAIVSTAIGLVFLLSFKTHSQSALGTPAAALGTPTPGSPTAAGTAVSAGPGQPSGSATGTSDRKKTAKSGQASASPSPSASPGAAKTVTGEAVDTIYGPVQVRVTVKGGKITAVAATEYPVDSPRDYQINSYAIPALNQETLAAGSASIDSISGATYTSQGYIGSLQNALDQAGL